MCDWNHAKIYMHATPILHMCSSCTVHSVLHVYWSLNALSLCVVHVTVCPGAPEVPILVSSIPPNAALYWSPPSASGAWSYTYEVSWTNGSVIVPRQADTTGQIPGLQAETQYTVEITAYPESTLCPNQSTNFAFNTTQSKWCILHVQDMTPCCYMTLCHASLRLL